jgi:hypothetical protein
MRYPQFDGREQLLDLVEHEVSNIGPVYRRRPTCTGRVIIGDARMPRSIRQPTAGRRRPPWAKELLI